MPFKSEKQRKYLWLKHPDIAKRWAHEYPESNKNLPTYADDNKKDPQTQSRGKSAHFGTLEGPARVFLAPILAKQALIAKKSESILEPVEVPKTHGPVMAGNETQDLDVGPNPVNKPKDTDCEKTHKIAGILQTLARSAWKGNMHKSGVQMSRGMQEFQWAQESRESLLAGRPLPPRPNFYNLSGKSYLSFLEGANAQATQSRMNALIPPPIGSQSPAQNPAPVATYPGMTSTPQSAPQSNPNIPSPNQPFTTTGKPITGGMKGMSNTIGRLGGLTSDDGQISSKQNIGSTGFGNAPNTPKTQTMG